MSEATESGSFSRIPLKHLHLQLAHQDVPRTARLFRKVGHTRPTAIVRTLHLRVAASRGSVECTHVSTILSNQNFTSPISQFRSISIFQDLPFPTILLLLPAI